MPAAHILLDVGRDVLPVEKLSRAVRIKATVEQLGFEPVLYDDTLVDRTRVSNMETQLNVQDSHQADFADRFETLSKDRVRAGDVIIATEAWHERCFKGLLSIDGGLYRNVPVVELWIEHLQSFARYRVFSTRFAMHVTAGLLRQTAVHADWVQATPYYAAELTKDVSVHRIELNASGGNAAALSHLDHSARGVPVVAPDWGAASETVAHGLSGYLYRTAAGRDKAVARAAELPSQPIVAWMNETFSLASAVRQLEGYFSRIVTRG